MASKSLTDVPEQNHQAMRAAAQRPVTGPAATDNLAAGGGLEIPGGERHPGGVPIMGMKTSAPHEPIPGEHDATTLTHREPGAIGGAFNGTDLGPAESAVPADDQTTREWAREGGGRDGETAIRQRQQENQ